MFSLKLNFNYRDGLKSHLRSRLEALLQFEMPKILERLREATPVDTGEARDGWTLTYDLPNLKATISNPVEHIQNLNAGSSQQAPRHFIENVLLQHGRPSYGPLVRYTR